MPERNHCSQGTVLMLIAVSQGRNNAVPPPRTILMPMKFENGYVRKVLVQFSTVK